MFVIINAYAMTTWNVSRILYQIQENLLSVTLMAFMRPLYLLSALKRALKLCRCCICRWHQRLHIDNIVRRPQARQTCFVVTRWHFPTAFIFTVCFNEESNANLAIKLREQRVTSLCGASKDALIFLWIPISCTYEQMGRLQSVKNSRAFSNILLRVGGAWTHFSSVANIN